MKLKTRREMLTAMAGAGLAAAMAPLAGCVNAGPRRRDAVANENAKPGTTDWLLTRTRVDPRSKYRCPWIEGYCSRTSVVTARK